MGWHSRQVTVYVLPAGALGPVTLKGGVAELPLPSTLPSGPVMVAPKLEPGQETVIVRSCLPSAPAAPAGAVDWS